MSSGYNPLDKLQLGLSIKNALLQQDVHPLPPASKFEGAGIYALHYTGRLSFYRSLAERNADGKFEAPLYVGEAVPEGYRKGHLDLHSDSKPAHKLYQRLRHHAKSIGEAENLTLEDFRCRYLVVDDIWIPLGEALMISACAPAWNKCVEGFGIHTPGEGRRLQNTSAWDTLHPGRSFVRKLDLPPHPKTRRQLEREVEEFLALPLEKRASAPTVDAGED